MAGSGSLAAPQNSPHPFGGAFRLLSFAHACDEFCGIDPDRRHMYTTLSKNRG